MILDRPGHPRLNFKKILIKQKHDVRIIFHEEKEANARPLLNEIHALNVYQINILQILTFMQKVKNAIIPKVFLNTFEEIVHKKYPINFLKYNFKQPSAFTNYAKFSISSRGPQLWNIILSETEKKHLKASYF